MIISVQFLESCSQSENIDPNATPSEVLATFAHGSSISFTCSAGYQGDSVTISCNDGMWEGSFPVCNGEYLPFTSYPRILHQWSVNRKWSLNAEVFKTLFYQHRGHGSNRKVAKHISGVRHGSRNSRGTTARPWWGPERSPRGRSPTKVSQY